MAVNKPAGLLVHRTDLDAAETRFALQMVREQLGQRVHPVHRLDKPTSGVLLFALSSASARTFGDAFQAGRMRKSYLAVVRGYAPEELEIEHAVRVDRPRSGGSNASRTEAGKPLPPRTEADGSRRSSAEKGASLPPRVEAGRSLFPSPEATTSLPLRTEATTYVRRLATIELPTLVETYPTSRYSLVHCEPRTGKRHQIRKHLKHLGHPIIGDVRYGRGAHNRYFREELGVDRLLLAATRLEFEHPRTGATVRIDAPLDDAMTGLFERWGWIGAIPLD